MEDFTFLGITLVLRSVSPQCAHFTGPADDTVVEPLPNCHGPEAPKKYEPVSAREHLLRKLGRSNTDVLKDLKLK